MRVVKNNFKESTFYLQFFQGVRPLTKTGTVFVETEIDLNKQPKRINATVTTI